jgi:hypothetical protein
MESNQTPIEPNFSNNVTSQSKLTEVIAPLHRVTPVSKILAAVVMIILPFVGFLVGYTYAPEKVVEVPVNYLKNTTTQTPGNVSESELSDSNVVIYSVEDSKIRGEGRSYPVLSLYKKYGGANSIKFATVGAVGEYPIQFAVSPNKKKVAVNLESKLILIDVGSGEKETIYTPKFVVGGRIAFSPDSSKVAFVDGNYYVETENVTLYTYDLIQKKLIEQITSQDLTFIDVDNWRTDNILLVSVTAPKGCAQANYKLFDLNNKSFTSLPTISFASRSIDGQYVIQSVDKIRPPVCEDSAQENMCSEIVYYFTRKMSVSDPVKNVSLGNFGDGSQAVGFIALSPKADQVLYAISPMPTITEQCDSNLRNTTYEIKNLKTGLIEPVSDLSQQLQLWGITLINKETSNEYGQENKNILTSYYRIYN